MCVLWFSSGCTLCLGKSFFRFNHPEEANHMKNMLPEKTAGPALSLSTGEWHLPPPYPLVLVPFCCLFINRVTCLQPNWSSPLSCHRLFYTQEECNSVPSVLLFCAIFVFVCLFVKHVNMLISLNQCCFLLSIHF